MAAATIMVSDGAWPQLAADRCSHSAPISRTRHAKPAPGSCRGRYHTDGHLGHPARDDQVTPGRLLRPRRAGRAE